MGSNRWESEARARKVNELVATARARKVTALEVAVSNGTRRMLAAEMQRRLPSARYPSDETWMLVVATLEACERIDASGWPLVDECGCASTECCVACCSFPKCGKCGAECGLEAV